MGYSFGPKGLCRGCKLFPPHPSSLARAGKDMSDLYDKIKEDVAFRRNWAEKSGYGFELLSVVPNVPKLAEQAEAAKAA
jgi:hypothetical protein